MVVVVVVVDFANSSFQNPGLTRMVEQLLRGV